MLGPNGAGKTSLLRAILGAQPLTGGSIELLGAPVRRGHRLVGYVPQQRLADRGTPLRARDFVGLGLDGHRFGLPAAQPNATAGDRSDAGHNRRHQLRHPPDRGPVRRGTAAAPGRAGADRKPEAAVMR